MTNFKYPIEYQKDVYTLKDNIKKDLELLETHDENSISIYERFLQPKTLVGKNILPNITKYYTSDVEFLRDTQETIKNLSSLKETLNSSLIDKTYKAWESLKKEEYFIDKYQYIGWERLKWLNYSKVFLHILSFYNLFSPVFNLVSPLFVFIMPYFILKAMRMKINWKMYKQILMLQLKNHAVGQLFTSFHKVKPSQKLYILFCAGMYFYSIYQNIISCKNFYNNSYFISNNFSQLITYLSDTINNKNIFYEKTKDLESYNEFNKTLLEKKQEITHFLQQLKKIPEKAISFKTLFRLGNTMKLFYTLYDNVEVEEILNFSFTFNGYLDCLMGIKDNLNNYVVNNSKFFKNKKKCSFKDIYHPAVENPIKNNIDFKTNKIITGPNASGTTTLLKSALINVILTQQFGCGYYKKLTMKPYDFIHSYLNIPDTSGRDSLFQAEARRCKEILDIIVDHPDKSHICIFDGFIQEQIHMKRFVLLIVI